VTVCVDICRHMSLYVTTTTTAANRRGRHQKWVKIKKNPRLGGGKYRGFRPRFPHEENGACSLYLEAARGGITHAPKGTASNLARGFLESQASEAHYLGIFFRPATVAYGPRPGWPLHRPRRALEGLIESLLKIAGRSPNVDGHRRLPAVEAPLIKHATHINSTYRAHLEHQ